MIGEAEKRKILDWPTRLSIALGAARGKKIKLLGCYCFVIFLNSNKLRILILLKCLKSISQFSGLMYLHTCLERSVIHRDVKSSNILLDNSMCAKVADFGFSKYAPQEGDSNASLEVRGTAGYMDPE